MARALWKGSITFGLVNIPIQLNTAVREKSVNFNLLSKDGTCRLRRKLYCPETGVEYDFSDTARGIEVAPDQYVIVDQKEIDQIKPERGRTIEIEQFIDMNELDPIYFDRVYYVTPAEGSAKPYKLLVQAMQSSGKSAVARFTMHQRQHLAVLRIVGEGIAMHTLHYADEVIPLEDLLPGTLDKAKLVKQELDVAERLIDALSRRLEVADFRDEYREQLQALIDAKSEGKTLRVSDTHPDEPPPRTINLMEALKKSLKENRAARTSRPPARRKSA